MDKIIGIGNALVDVLVTLKDEVLINELGLQAGGMTLIDENKFANIKDRFKTMETHKANGGSAGNTIRALAIMGSKVGFIGKTGDDEFGHFFVDSCESVGIDTKITISELPSGVASTFISPNGERTFATYLGAASTLKAEDLRVEMFEGYSYLYLEGYLVQDHDMILTAVEMAKQAGLQICLDMASYNIVEAEKEIFTLLLNKYVDIVFANEEEVKAFTGKAPEEALNDLAQYCSISIVKMGKNGSIIKKGTEVIHVDALDVPNVVDTTGAGDFFAAGFLYGLTSGYSFTKCAKIGSLLASKVIQTIGTDLSEAEWNEIKEEVNTIVSE